MKKGLLNAVAAVVVSAAMLLPAGGPPSAAGYTAYAADAAAEKYGIAGVICTHGGHCTHEHYDADAEIRLFEPETFASGNVAAPTASQKSGTIYCVSDSFSLKLSAASGATVYYSVNGGKYKKYTSQIKLTKNSTIKAYAQKNGSRSSTATYKYKLAPSTLSVKFNVTDDAGGKLVRLTSDLSKLKLYYTTDGSAPTTKSNAYTPDGIKISETCKLSVLAVKSGWNKTKIIKEITVDGSSGSSEGSGSAASSKVVTKGTETRKCSACYTGYCLTCNGMKEIHMAIIGRVKCDDCNGTGLCTVCGGTREITVEVNVINKDAVPAGKEFKTCIHCAGAGVCPYCNGIKIYLGKKCGMCAGTGVCDICNGSGGELADKPAPDIGGGSSAGSEGSGGSSGGGSSVIVPNPVCNICGGTGTCSLCFGTGKVKQYKDRVTCPSCGGTRKCKYCGGIPWSPTF